MRGHENCDTIVMSLTEGFWGEKTSLDILYIVVVIISAV